MVLSVIFGVFDKILKCPDCGDEIKSHGSHEEKILIIFIEIGKGHSAMTTFSKVLNMPVPPRCANFTKIQNKKLLSEAKQCANDSMVNNAMHVMEITENDAGECGISIDGTSQKRSYSSHNGVVTAISLDTKKCLDVEVKSNKCNSLFLITRMESQPMQDQPYEVFWQHGDSWCLNPLASNVRCT